MEDIKTDLKQRDAIDFGSSDVGKLFRQMLLPTLIGMISMVVLNLADGAFVGRGVGSNALAAVNIVAPLFTITSGFGLMFGIGVSIVASIHLAKGKPKAANINITQALIAALILGVIISAAVLSNLETICRLFGSSDVLTPLAASYLKWIALFVPFNLIGIIGMFIVRLDGSPKYAMCVNLVGAVLNIFLDWLFVFPLQLGLEGAAIATFISFGLSTVMVIIYLFFFTRTIKLYRLKLTWKSLRLGIRNLSYQIKLGSSAFLGDVAISGVMIVGNYIFMEYLGEDGVAAFSVGCYCLPVVFMLGSAVVQSSQPIISYGYGANNSKRVGQAVRLALKTAAGFGLLSTLLVGLGSRLVSAMFLGTDCHAYELAVAGLPLFAIGCLFIAINLAVIGYYQSVEQAKKATIFTLLRGFIFVIPSFILLPKFFGVPGIWLAVPFAEFLTLITAGLDYKRSRLRA